MKYFRGIFKNNVARGTVLTITGYGLGQVLRLGGNLILTRLLFPEMFGLMTLVFIVIQGVGMFADIGIGTSIIRSKQGDEPYFLRTAWTLQIIRGLVLWILICAITWPVSALYNEPQLLWILPVAGISALIAGFNSTAIFSENRHLRLTKLVVTELSAQSVGLLFMLVTALLSPNILSLVLGSLITAVTTLVLSHKYLPSISHKFELNKNVIHEIVQFGRWILLSTIFAFLAAQGDRLVLGKLVSLENLGIYSIAFMLSQTVVMAVQAVSSKILLPFYSRLMNETQGEMRAKIKSLRTGILAVSIIPICILTLAGDNIIDLLYDDRYKPAGWMLQILSLGSAATIVNLTLSPILLAVGNSRMFLIMVIVKTTLVFITMGVSYYIADFQGIVIGIAISNFLFYPVIILGTRKYGLWTPIVDFSYFLVILVILVIGWKIWY
jgi:O-antigen/teichoic acid export membrane protein